MAVGLFPVAVAVAQFPKDHRWVGSGAHPSCPDSAPWPRCAEPTLRGRPAAASCLTPDGFQTPSNGRAALQNLAEQVLDFKAHLYVKLNRYRSLICNLD